MRVVAGTAGGRRLAVPKGRDTRPTSERVREALFSALVSDRGTLTGAAVLDLFAGSGALGLEALSRDAATAVLVEKDPGAAATARANVATLGLPGATVVAASVARYLARPPTPVDVVFADPPYALPEAQVAAVLTALAGGWLRGEASVVVERAKRSPVPAWPAGFVVGRVRTYGDTAVHPARWVAGQVPGAPWNPPATAGPDADREPSA